MIFKSIYTDRSDREDVFDELLQGGVDDPSVDDRLLADLFNDHAGGVEMYIRTGCNVIIDHLEESVKHVEFLNSETNNGIKVIDVIKGTLL